MVESVRSGNSQHSVAREFGTLAIHGHLGEPGLANVPSIRTINRILARHGVFDGRRRVRRPNPPQAWYPPDIASGKAELDQYDTVSGLIIEGGIEVEVLNAISLHGSLIASWPRSGIKASIVRDALVEHPRAFGCPDYAQFDNDNRFQGPHNHPDAIGSIISLCLSLNVTPVFVAPRETGFQAAIASLNNRWQQKVWERRHHETLEALRGSSWDVAARGQSEFRPVHQF
ncbi:MAG TPA: hypothetical protein VMX94_04810 [Armatimonadota bacterium]|nr:hypothetical protein [Armatimonadota bacterium]